ncbi:NAD(P)/FAD-dependent oxidoreductase [Haloechinothrix sp. YIM 98757]|uniref:NAD(P)/FAD-dependent oxidoreductase n=1 Tax=Haloechinothrix aidingensis TaxID=2752311 RepID=A0A838AER8_9PSEU|nr:NAD(P)/FAD-dependent oxidoreductase [Haloechinothrix aidingensis]MBA0127657.1 NAD(P)/FAD-dependent oxidoreductase [Haloechinothrix aidingensis]
MTERHNDVVIIGGGAAGLNAALVLARARRQVLVVDSEAPRNAVAAHMHGFVTRDGTPPGDLRAIGRAEVTGYGAEIMRGNAREVERTADGFALRLLDGRVVRGRSVLLASGLTDELPEITGLAQRWGRDVVTCPYCHGWEVRQQPLAVLGTGPMSVHQALMLRQWSDDVTLIRNGAGEIDAGQTRRLDARGIRVVAGTVDHVVVEGDRLTGMALAGGSVVPCSAAFVATRMLANDEAIAALGVDVEQDALGDRVVTDEAGRTSVAGVWAAGNVTDRFASVIVAAAGGAKVAMALNAELVEEDIAAGLG